MRISVLIKTLAVVFCSFFIFFLTSSIACAQRETTQVNKTTSNTNIDSGIPNNLHNRTQLIMLETMSAFACQLTGHDPLDPNKACLGLNLTSGTIGFISEENSGNKGNGLIGQMGGMIASLYTPPARSGDYFQYLAQDFGITKKAYAQQTGDGYNSLTRLLPTWRVFRNIAYTFLVAIFVIIGLAIMLRVKIDPRTVMTVQNQIPKVIIGILLITFSYAIAGFLIDVMYVSIHVAGNTITSGSGQPTSLTTTLVEDSHNPFEAVGTTINGSNSTWGLLWLVGKSATSIGAITEEFIAPFLSGIISGTLYDVLGASTGPAVLGFWDSINPFSGDFFVWDLVGGTWDFITDPTGTITDAVAGVINWLIGWIVKIIIDALLFVIIGIILLVALFRLWFSLLFSYVKILIYVVLAPLWIMAGILPGSPIGFGSWLRSMLANLASFPIAIIMLLFAKVFFEMFGVGGGDYFVPPLVGDRTVPSTLGPIIALGIILIIPNVISAFHKSIKSPGIGFALGAMIGAGTGVLMGGTKSTGGVIAASRWDITGKATPEGRTGRVVQHLVR